MGARLRLAGLVLAGALALAPVAGAEQAVEPANSPGGTVVPSFWPVEKRIDRPDVSKILNIRFLTETTYPPFNYMDEDGRLIGFNVTLARVLCEELKVECIMRTRAWDRLEDELAAGKGDAIIASLAMTTDSRARLDFTDRYYMTPARFAVNRNTGYGEMTPEGLRDRTVGVVRDSAHEAYLKALFPDTPLKVYDDRDAAHAGLRGLEVEAVFDDAISLMFWLNGTASQDCCAFRGGAYYDSRYFGEGVGIAVAKGNDQLRRALNYALRRVYAKGAYEEIFLRYFPLSYY